MNLRGSEVRRGARALRRDMSRADERAGQWEMRCRASSLAVRHSLQVSSVLLARKRQVSDCRPSQFTSRRIRMLFRLVVLGNPQQISSCGMGLQRCRMEHCARGR